MKITPYTFEVRTKAIPAKPAAKKPVTMFGAVIEAVKKLKPHSEECVAVPIQGLTEMAVRSLNGHLTRVLKEANIPNIRHADGDNIFIWNKTPTRRGQERTEETREKMRESARKSWESGTRKRRGTGASAGAAA